MLFEHFFFPHSRHTTRNVTQHSNKDMIFFSDINKEWDDELLRNFTAAFSTWVKTFQSSLKCNDFKSYDGIFLKIHLLQHITLKVGDALICQTIISIDHFHCVSYSAFH